MKITLTGQFQAGRLMLQRIDTLLEENETFPRTLIADSVKIYDQERYKLLQSYVRQ